MATLSAGDMKTGEDDRPTRVVERIIPDAFELHRSDRNEAKRLLIVFSAANAKSFTFYRNTIRMRPDILYVREPAGNQWYQHGLRESETLPDMCKEIAEISGRYEEVYTLGSSMGGYAALYVGAVLEAKSVLAIAPQIIVDPRFSRGPTRKTNILTKNIAPFLTSSKSRFNIAYGNFDVIDIYNMDALHKHVEGMSNFRIIEYDSLDHMFPKEIDIDCTLEKFFRGLLFRDEIATNGLPYSIGLSVPKERIEIVNRYVNYTLKSDFRGCFDYLSSVLDDHSDWAPAKFMTVEMGQKIGLEASELVDWAIEIADRHPRIIDYNYAAAELLAQIGKPRTAQNYLDRTFKVRSNYARGKRLWRKLNKK